MSDKNVPMYHWMIAAQVVFTDPEAEDGGGVIPLNAVLLTTEPRVNAMGLSQAQRTVIANLHEKTQSKTLKVIDIVFLSFNNLGQMTREEFNPDGEVKPGVN